MLTAAASDGKQPPKKIAQHGCRFFLVGLANPSTTVDHS
jgi:hypothetical protein